MVDLGRTLQRADPVGQLAGSKVYKAIVDLEPKQLVIRRQMSDEAHTERFADLAVLRCPNERSFPKEADAYEHLVAGASTFMVEATLARQAQDDVHREGLVLSLEGQWQPCSIRCRSGGPLQVTKTEGHLHPCMAGSPILSLTGGVLGVISGGGTDLVPTHSNLALDLPQKFLQWMTIPGLSSLMPLAMYP